MTPDKHESITIDSLGHGRRSTSCELGATFPRRWQVIRTIEYDVAPTPSAIVGVFCLLPEVAEIVDVVRLMLDIGGGKHETRADAE